MDTLILQYILEHLMKLVNNNICCICFLGPFFDLGQQINSEIEKFGLKSQDHIINGHKVKRAYNGHCCHCIDVQRPFHLTEQSQKDILYHIKTYNYNGLLQDVLPPSLFKPTRLIPVLPANRFTIVPLRQNTFHSDVMRKEFVPKSWRLYPFKYEILKKINENQILVINGDASLNKSTTVPLSIVEESIAKETYCKILCVESDNLMAITHSTFIADHLNERIGSRVGFQVHLQSRVCDNTNIIFTTAVFFLRVLMGNGSIDSFRYISHVVLSDVHLHHAYKDIFLNELKNISVHYPHIKIILLSDSSDNKNLLYYFGKGQELCLNTQLNKLKIYHVEDIIELVQNQSQLKPSVENIISLIAPIVEKDTEIADNALEQYNVMGNETALNNFMYLVKCDKIDINHMHSKDGYTALIAAVKHGNPIHVKCLLTFQNANSFYQDKFKISALEYAISINSIDCIRVLTERRMLTEYEPKPPPIDFELICKLIQVISTDWIFGNILVFLPTYEDLLKLNHKILKMQFLGKIQQEICINLLHPNVQPEQLQELLQNRRTGKLIISTELAESFAYMNDITYVIDSGQIFREKYRPKFKCIESSNEWISQESLRRRSLIASRFTAGHCFRLISRNIPSKLPPMSPPELHYIPLNRITLTVKLLRPDVAVTHYFQDTIVMPPPEHVVDSIEFLKDIEAFDTTLQVTWLGSRLIDVPINLELGKALVISILFKCLDPVLTIASFLTYINSSKLFQHKTTATCDAKWDPFLLHDDSCSDLLKFLRIYQNWQDEKRSKIACDVISDEETFILNGVLENVCDIRTNLVGALRSSQLIHNQGLLSMHSINAKANNWAIIKAALVGGLYPKICMINPLDNKIKSKSSELCIHESSVLHPSNLRRVKSSPLSDWVIYFGETNNLAGNIISNCTLISPATVALFAGKMEMNPKNILFTNGRVGFYIDEHIWLVTDSNSALLTFALRERLYAAFMDYLQTCANIDKWRNSYNMPYVFDVISKILLEEDKTAGFRQPNHVGNRPKAIASKFTSAFELARNSNNFFLEKNSARPFTPPTNHRFLEKQFFLINIFDSHHSSKSFWNMPMMDLSKDTHFKTIRDLASEENLLYVVVCSATKKRIVNIALIRCEDGAFMLRHCFQVNIPLHEVIITCAALKLSPPSLSPGWMPHKLDNTIGEIILELW